MPPWLPPEAHNNNNNNNNNNNKLEPAGTRVFRRLQIESTQAESQWIVRQAYSQHLQYLEAIKSSAKDLSLPIFEIAQA
jgi:hypothetical protein